ncbi:MAG: tyrosine-type recombinase/integrase [Hyphomicrobiaceae bacterium]
MERARGLNRLTALEIKAAQSAGWYGDGGGLYLEVDAKGGRRWMLRLVVGGRRRDFGLGGLHKVSLAQARARAVEYRSLAYQGIDPVAEKRARRPAPVVPSFEKAATEVHRDRMKGWSNGKHVDQWINTLRDHAFPVIGSRPISEIGTPDVLKVLTPIWLTKPETARRVRQRMKTVLEWGRAAGHRSGENPVDLIGDALPKSTSANVEHHAALPFGEVGAFVRALRSGQSETATKLAFEFLILTASRTIEVRRAKWDQIDWAAKVWTRPAEDMKARREHAVPLSARAMEILREAKALGGDATGGLIFQEGSFGRGLSENRFLNAREAIGYGERCTPHGFRSSFRDWAAETTQFPSEVVEMALAHTIKNKAEAAYRRGDLLAKRRELMDAWAAHVGA